MLVGKRLYALVAGAIIAAGPVLAAEYYGGMKEPPPPPPGPPPGPWMANWQGFYLGAAFGWSWTTINAANNVFVISGPDTVPFARPGTTGMIGGAVAGYNMQAGNFVYGIEADLGGLDAGASGIRSQNGTTVAVKSSAGVYGDITGRAGITIGNALVYAKGGFAFFTGNVRINITTDDPSYISQDSGAFTGWTAGGGLEYRFARNLSAKLEYQYIDVSNLNFSCCIAAAPGTIEDTILSNTFKVGVNFYLNDIRSPLD